MAYELEVGSLPYDISKEELHTVFSTYGAVNHVQVHDNGTALVQYNERIAADDAVQVLHNIYKIRTDAPHPITVRWAKEGDNQPQGGRNTSSDAGWSDSSQQGNYSARSSDGEGGGSGGGQMQGSGYKVFVGGLPEDISESELRHVFGTYGSVNHVHIMRAHATTGLRAAFVFYDAKDSGDDAIKVLNDIYKIRRDAEAPISVRWGKEKEEKNEQDNKLFVGNLPNDITEQEVRQVFETYGKVNLIHMLNPKNQSGDRAALVFYEDRDSGEDAIRALHDVYKIRTDAEHPIRVKWGRDGNQRNDSWNSGGGAGWGSSSGGYGGGGGGGGYGGGGWQDKRSDSSWKDSSWNSGGSDWSGNSWNDGGRNNWQDHRNDHRNGWDDGGYNNNNWQQENSWSSRGGDRGNSWHDQGKGKGGGGRDYGGKGSGYNPEIDDKSGRLYVSNLPEDITEESMNYVFSNYGPVDKIHIMDKKVVKGCVSAFVEYTAADDADTAIASLNDKYEIRNGYGPIVVRHANRPRSKPY